jgi:glycosyltransferase involved in cell wall biosynthesis
MKILQAHVRHVSPGGSEVLFDNLVVALRARGHEVMTVERDNGDIRGVTGGLRAALDGLYSPRAGREMRELIDRERPDVAHFHNLYPQLSPAVVRACNEAGVPVVMSLHDYKLVCPTAQYFRDGAPCHRCSGGREYHCVLANCRGSLLESTAYAARTALARRAGWLTRGVDRFVACSDFVRGRYVGEGFPAERIVVIPNLSDMPARLPPRPQGGYAAFVGRISPEKGIRTLLDAARISGIPVRVAGAGTGALTLTEMTAPAAANVEFVGPLGRAEVAAFLAGARFLVVPSLFEEPFGIVAAEAMGQGVPVIAARSGGLPEVVEDGETGLLVPPGDVAALAERMRLLWNDPALALELGRQGREKALREYEKGIYCTRLERVYESILSSRSTPVAAAG